MKLQDCIRTVFVFAVALFPSLLFAGRYQEHKKIGDEAFTAAIDSLRRSNGDTAITSLVEQYIGMKPDSNGYAYRLNDLLSVSFGDLSALSGDHVDNPLSLINFLFTPLSKTRETVLHIHNAIKRGGDEVDDIELYNIDGSYLTLAARDLSHFYKYGFTLEEHIKEFKKEHLIQLQCDVLPTFPWLKATPSYHTVIKSLENVNAICKYITLHSFALFLADTAGYCAKNGNKKTARSLLQYALFFEGYASHYLQDAFSSGHLVVRRSLIGAFLNDDKTFHDLYGKMGIDVTNLRGDRWVSYGDREMNKIAGGLYRDEYIHSFLAQLSTDSSQRHHTMLLESPKADKHNVMYTLIDLSKSVAEQRSRNMSLAIEAGANSIYEVFNEFITAQDSATFFSIEDELANIETDSLTPFFIQRFRALSIIPIPFETFSDNFFISEETRLADYRKKYPTISNGNAKLNEAVNYVPTRRAVGINTGNAISISLQTRYPIYKEDKAGILLFGTSVTARGLSLYENLMRGSGWFNYSAHWYNTAKLHYGLVGIEYVPSLTSIFSYSGKIGVASESTVERFIAGADININAINILKISTDFIFRSGRIVSFWDNLYYLTNFKIQAGFYYIGNNRSAPHVSLEIDLNSGIKYLADIFSGD